jgi:copper(I)-binding protein
MEATALSPGCAPPSAEGGAQAEIEIHDARIVVRGVGEPADMLAPSDAASGTPAAPAIAGYLIIQNKGSQDDRLTNVFGDFAALTMMHKTTVDAQGVARMEAIGTLRIPAAESVTLEPGGLHLMFMGPRTELLKGSQVKLTLEFETAGSIVVTADVTGD